MSLSNCWRGRIGRDQFRITIPNMLVVPVRIENREEPDRQRSQGSGCSAIKAAAAVLAVQRKSCSCCLCSLAKQPAAGGGNSSPSAHTPALAHRHCSRVCCIRAQPSKSLFCLSQVKLTLTTPREFPASFENDWCKWAKIASVSIVSITSNQAKMVNLKLWCWE